MKILKTGTCKSSSGQSTLTYHIGKDQSGIHFHIDANTGGGLFSKEWISLSAIQETIDKSNKPFTSAILHPLFQGKSINTPSFMLAVLLHEGLIKREKRCYVKGDSKGFMDSIKSLVESTADDEPTKRKPASNRKAAPKTTP